MTVSSVVIKPIESLKNWYKLIFVSRRDGIGETITEMLISEETLKSFRQQLDKTTGEHEQTDYSDYPENLRKFMSEDETK